jgi:hypothetical protein
MQGRQGTLTIIETAASFKGSSPHGATPLWIRPRIGNRHRGGRIPPCASFGDGFNISMILKQHARTRKSLALLRISLICIGI